MTGAVLLILLAVEGFTIFEPDGTNVPTQTFWRAQASASYEVDLFGRVKQGDQVVIIAGSPPSIPGSTNALRVHRMGDAVNGVAPAYRRM